MKISTRLVGLSGFLILLGSFSLVFAETYAPTIGLANIQSAKQNQIPTSEYSPQNPVIEELKLDKSTFLALGEGAEINLNKPPNNEKLSNATTLVSLEKGPFRIISSSTDKKNLKIRTPNLQLVADASVLDLYIAPNGAEYLLLHSGSTKVCKKGNSDPLNCRILNTPCDLIRVSPAGKISQSIAWRDRTTELELTFSETFPFVLTPPLSDPVVYHSRVGVEENKCGPTSIANQNITLEKVYETGSLPETKILNDKSKIEKKVPNDKDLSEKVRSNRIKYTSNTKTCIQCTNDEKADKYWSKIIIQAENHLSTWWSSLNQTKNYNKTEKN